VTAPTAPASPGDASDVATEQPTPEVSPRSARVVALVVGVGVLALLALMVWGIGKRAEGTVGEVPVTARHTQADVIKDHLGPAKHVEDSIASCAGSGSAQ